MFYNPSALKSHRSASHRNPFTLRIIKPEDDVIIANDVTGSARTSFYCAPCDKFYARKDTLEKHRETQLHADNVLLRDHTRDSMQESQRASGVPKLESAASTPKGSDIADFSNILSLPGSTEVYLWDS